MAKALNTSHALYNNIVRALSGDEIKQEMNALDGKSGLTQSGFNCRADPSGLTFTGKQGIAFDGTYWYVTSSGPDQINKYDTSSVNQANNSSPFLNLPGATDHIGETCVDANYLYVVCDNYNAGNATVQSIVRYNKTDLTYHSHWDIQESGYNASGIAIANGELLVTSFEPADDITSVRATKIRRFNLTTGAKIGEFTLGTGILGIQGMVHDGENYWFSSHDIPNSYNAIHLYDSSFNYINKYNPSTGNVELEGLEWVNGELYFHEYEGSPQILRYKDNMYISKDVTESEPVKLLDAVDIGESGTLLFRITPQTLYNYNSIIDNLVDGNDWEAWFYADGRVGWRVDNANNLTHTGFSATTEYLLALTWSNSGGTVTTKIGVNGTYEATKTGTWKTPRDMYIGGANTANNQGDNAYLDILMFDKELSPAELSDTYTNFDTLFTELAVPVGAVTIGTITPDETTASVPFTYDNTDQTGFEYRLNGGAPVSATSPINLTGLTPNTAYTIEVRAINADGAGAWSTAENFTTLAETSDLSISITGIPDGTYNTVIMDNLNNTVYANTVTYTSGVATISGLSVAAGTQLRGFVISGDELDGAVITGTTV